MNNMQKAFKTKSSLRGMANGGEVFKNTIAGVPTFTDSRAATAGAKAYTPGQSGGTLSVIGQDPGTMAANAAAQKSIDARKAAAAPPPTLESALTSFFSNHSTTQAPATAPATSSSLRARQNTPAPQTQLAQDFNAFFPAAAPAMPHSTAPVSQQVMEDFRTFFPAAADSTSTTDRLAMRSPGRDFHPYMAHGGKVKGPGGPTSDDVGPVMLSDGEYVLPADTVDIVGRENLDALRLATHDFVDDDNKPKTSSLRKMANGGIVVEELTDPTSRRAFAQARAAINAGNPYGAQTVLNDTIPRASAAPAAAKAAAPAAAEAAAPAAVNTVGAGVARDASTAASKLGTVARVAGNALIPATAAYAAYTDSPEARNRAASGQEGVAGAASQVGSYLGSALAFGTSSPQDIGAVTSALRGEGTGAYHAVPDAEKGWARRLGERFFPTESAKIMAGGVRLPPAVQTRADMLKRNGIDASNMTGDDFTRARGLAEAASPGAPSHTSLNDAMGALRSGNEPGGGFAQTSVPGIFGRKSSDPKNDLGEYIGVGTPSPQEDPIMGEIRSALRGLTDGNSGQGGGFIGGSNSREINARYDKLAKQLSGMYSAKGQGNLARRLLELEQLRSNALEGDARNMSTLRGQDATARAEAHRTSQLSKGQALDALTSMYGTQQNNAANRYNALVRASQKASGDSDKESAPGKSFDQLMKSLETLVPDAERRRAYASRIMAGGQEQLGDLNSLDPQTAAAAGHDAAVNARIAELADQQTGSFGTRDSGLPRISGVRKGTSLSDIWNDWVVRGGSLAEAGNRFSSSVLPFGTDGSVYFMDDGRPVTAAPIDADPAFKRAADAAIADAPNRRKKKKDEDK